MVFVLLSANKFAANFFETPMGNTEEESAPPAIQTSIVPAIMLSVTLTAAWKLVAHARVTL